VVIFNSARLVRAGEELEMAEAPQTAHQRRVVAETGTETPAPQLAAV
jgi:hypothetical protein